MRTLTKEERELLEHHSESGRFEKKLVLITEAIGEFNRLADASDIRLVRGQNLIEKQVFHTVSAYTLAHNPILIPTLNGPEHNYDIWSVMTLARAAFEAYLLFHYIFVATDPPSDLFNFRYSAWHMESLALRQQPTLIPIRENAKIRKLLKENDEINALRKVIESTKVFASITGKSADTRKRLLLEKGKDWRSDSWKKIAVMAGFGPRYADRTYTFLSHYAHGGSISGWQVSQKRTLDQQQDFIKQEFDTLEILLSLSIRDMIRIFPGIGDRLGALDSAGLKHVEILASVPSQQP
jgi:hypothetical protein